MLHVARVAALQRHLLGALGDGLGAALRCPLLLRAEGAEPPLAWEFIRQRGGLVVRLLDARPLSIALQLGERGSRRRRERGGLALRSKKWRGARNGAAASTSARRAASACFSAVAAATFVFLTSSCAASSSASRRSLGGGFCHHRPEDTEVLPVRGRGTVGLELGDPVGDARGVLLFDELAERADAFKQRPGLRLHALLRAPPASAVEVGEGVVSPLGDHAARDNGNSLRQRCQCELHLVARTQPRAMQTLPLACLAFRLQGLHLADPTVVQMPYMFNVLISACEL